MGLRMFWLYTYFYVKYLQVYEHLPLRRLILVYLNQCW